MSGVTVSPNLFQPRSLPQRPLFQPFGAGSNCFYAQFAAGNRRRREHIIFASIKLRWNLNRGVVNRTAVDTSFDFSLEDDYLRGQKKRQPPRPQSSVRLSSLGLCSHRYGCGKVDGAMAMPATIACSHPAEPG